VQPGSPLVAVGVGPRAAVMVSLVHVLTPYE
jgi:hypothetical protein